MSVLCSKICERARLSKDARFDGLFFTAVRSTGVYCRPVCPAPVPKRHNVSYFPSAAAAAAAGYRPCLRCRPELSPAAAAMDGDGIVQRALDLIGEGALETGSIDSLAVRLGISDRQLRRLFLDRTGATPIAVHSTRRLLLAKQLLTETSLPVTEVAHAAGFGSLRRFNSAFRESCGMAPTALRRRQDAPPAGVLSLRLAYRPPLDFPVMLAFLAKRATPGVERVVAGAYERVEGAADAATRIRVTADPKAHELRIEIAGAPPRAIPGIVRRVRRMFDLDADMASVHAALGEDRLLARAIGRRPGLRVPVGWDGFEVALRGVLGQEISVVAAATLAGRLVREFGGRLPTPEDLADAPLETIGLPRARAAALRSLARAVLDGRIDFGAGQRLEDFVSRFVELPGMGRWTAQYVALRGLGHPDAFPAGDLGLQQALGRGRRLSPRETEARSQTWRPWRAYAVLQLWHWSGDRRRERS